MYSNTLTPRSLAVERLRVRGGGGTTDFLTSFLPCNAHRVNVIILHSRGARCPGAPRPAAYALASSACMYRPDRPQSNRRQRSHTCLLHVLLRCHNICGEIQLNEYADNARYSAQFTCFSLQCHYLYGQDKADEARSL